MQFYGLPDLIINYDSRLKLPIAVPKNRWIDSHQIKYVLIPTYDALIPKARVEVAFFFGYFVWGSGFGPRRDFSQ